MQKRNPTVIATARLPRLGIIRLGMRDSTGRASELDHFVFDVPDKVLLGRIIDVYGASPKSLDITFHTNELEAVYLSEYQRWGLSKQRKPYKMCSGNGNTAEEYGKKESRCCPCDLFGRDCRKKTMLKFLIPSISMGGTFLLVTKSEYSTQIIQTTLGLALRSGGLIMRPFKLSRTSGYATINNLKVKKYFIALTLDEKATVLPLEEKNKSVRVGKPKGQLPIERLPDLIKFIPPPLSETDLAVISAHKEQTQLRRDRERVRLKLKLYIKDPRAEAALEIYACERFGKETFYQLTRGELVILQHDLDQRREILGAIYERMLSALELPGFGRQL